MSSNPIGMPRPLQLVQGLGAVCAGYFSLIKATACVNTMQMIVGVGLNLGDMLLPPASKCQVRLGLYPDFGAMLKLASALAIPLFGGGQSWIWVLVFPLYSAGLTVGYRLT